MSLNSAASVIIKKKLIVICRKIYEDTLLRIAEALLLGGVNLIEVTFDQADPDSMTKTPNEIGALKRHFGEQLHVGAGTVLSSEQIEAAGEAGAEYIISPNTDVDVIRATKRAGLVSIPGAMTPSEIMAAHNAGADFIKLFPAGYLGFDYIKDVMAPISHVKFVATGGVDEESFGRYLAAGFFGAGVGGRLANVQLAREGNYQEITRRARVFVEIAQASNK